MFLGRIFFWYWCFYPHRSRNALSPVCVFFFHYGRVQRIHIVIGYTLSSLLCSHRSLKEFTLVRSSTSVIIKQTMPPSTRFQGGGCTVECPKSTNCDVETYTAHFCSTVNCVLNVVNSANFQCSTCYVVT